MEGDDGVIVDHGLWNRGYNCPAPNASKGQQDNRLLQCVMVLCSVRLSGSPAGFNELSDTVIWCAMSRWCSHSLTQRSQCFDSVQPLCLEVHRSNGSK